MPKIITVPNPNKVRFRGDVTVDIDAFVTFAEQVRREPVTQIPNRWAVASLFAFDEHGRVVITPRGEDLLASAHLIPEDPPPPKSEAPKCSECKGEGKFELFVSFVDCKACKGTGDAPMPMFEDTVEKFDFTQRAIPFVPLVQPNGIPTGSIKIAVDGGKLNQNDTTARDVWVRLGRRKDVEPFVGEPVELRTGGVRPVFGVIEGVDAQGFRLRIGTILHFFPHAPSVELRSVTTVLPQSQQQYTFAADAGRTRASGPNGPYYGRDIGMPYVDIIKMQADIANLFVLHGEAEEGE